MIAQLDPDIGLLMQECEADRLLELITERRLLIDATSDSVTVIFPSGQQWTGDLRQLLRQIR